jgi:hypothetical protein
MRRPVHSTEACCPPRSQKAGTCKPNLNACNVDRGYAMLHRNLKQWWVHDWTTHEHREPVYYLPVRWCDVHDPWHSGQMLPGADMH